LEVFFHFFFFWGAVLKVWQVFPKKVANFFQKFTEEKQIFPKKKWYGDFGPFFWKK
jgi:hypothetical protein